jgi:hypothetical protein
MADQTQKPQGTFAKLMSSSLSRQEQKSEKLISLTTSKSHLQNAGKPANLQTKKKESNVHSASMHASKQDSLQASNHANTLSLSTNALETIRKIVKNPGKEDVLYVRLTKEEKDKLADVSYTYKRQGIRTSDNEVVRVAINALLEDYKTNGENSLLSLVIASLHA